MQLSAIPRFLRRRFVSDGEATGLTASHNRDAPTHAPVVRLGHRAEQLGYPSPALAPDGRRIAFDEYKNLPDQTAPMSCAPTGRT